MSISTNREHGLQSQNNRPNHVSQLEEILDPGVEMTLNRQAAQELIGQLTSTMEESAYEIYPQLLGQYLCGL